MNVPIAFFLSAFPLLMVFYKLWNVRLSAVFLCTFSFSFMSKTKSRDDISANEAFRLPTGEFWGLFRLGLKYLNFFMLLEFSYPMPYSFLFSTFASTRYFFWNIQHFFMTSWTSTGEISLNYINNKVPKKEPLNWYPLLVKFLAKKLKTTTKKKLLKLP